MGNHVAKYNKHMNIEVQPYKPDDTRKWVVKPLEKFLGLNEDRSLMYEMGITPQMTQEPEWCIFMCTVIKEIANNRFGKVLECHVTSGFKIHANGKSLTPDFLYPLMVMAFDTFIKIYNDRNSGLQQAQNRIIDRPEYKDYERDLSLCILMAGTSKQ